jgi:hypothetical protein
MSGAVTEVKLWANEYSFLGAFVQAQKACITFVMSVYPFVCV